MKIIQLIIALFLTTPILSQPGALDVTFGNGGKVITRFNDYEAVATSMQTQSDGKIVVSGIGVGDSDNDIIAVRYLPNGQFDPTFGINGRFSLSISNYKERCNNAAIDENDNILLFGITSFENRLFQAFVLKLSSDGLIDSSFAQNGLWTSEGPEMALIFNAILIQPDRKILMAGRTTTLMGDPPYSCTLIRLHPNGTLDSTFGVNGIAKATLPDSYIPEFVTLTKNGDIITGGSLSAESPKIVLLKFNQRGSIDSTFGTNGILIDDVGYRNFGSDIAIQSDNKILVATGVNKIPEGENFEMARYFPNGTLDTEFGQNGRVTTNFGDTPSQTYSIVLQEDGKIILGGYSGRKPNRDYAIARYDSHGNIDHTFGVNGKVTTHFMYDEVAYLSTIQSDGKLLCAGNSQNFNGSSYFSIARYLTQTETSTKEVSREITQVNVLPNPSDGHFTVSFALEKSSTVSISIFNASGQLVQSVVDDRYMMKGPNKLEIPLNHSLNDGIYILKLETSDDYITQKLVIHR